MKTQKSKILAALSALACLVATYCIIELPSVSIWAWLAGLPPAAIVSVTALVRGNEIPTEVDSWRSHLRRAGFFFSGMGALSFVISPLTGVWPSPRLLLLLWGIAATWLTTPNMPPWWDYITGKKKLKYKEIL